ncbi:MAG: glycosyltransferase family 4 protein [Candidatus Moranbacteria bacterium]|nr:glycosyltransferase family 4 protein [Candidatus Moranbacteria bacterium]
MRIGIDARFYGSVGKGLGRYTERLVSELEKIDQTNTYFIFLCQENYEEYQPKNSNFHKVLTRSRWYSFSEQLVFPWVLLGKRLDLVHFPHFNVPLLYRKSFVMTLHDLILFHYPTEKASTKSAVFYWMKFLLYRLVLDSALKRSRRVITVSDFTKEDIIKNYPFVRKKICVTKEAAEIFCYWQNREATKGILKRLGLWQQGLPQSYFLYVGNAYPHKNLSFLLSVAECFPEQKFVFVGREDFFYKRLKDEAEEKRLQNILFAGYVTDADLGVLYRYATLYIFPSLYEGFGLPPLEAMQYGTPVLSSDRGSLPEILGDAAYFFNPEEREGLRKSIENLLNNEALRIQYKTRGFTQAAGYSWQKMAEVTLAEYDKAR